LVRVVIQISVSEFFGESYNLFIFSLMIPLGSGMALEFARRGAPICPTRVHGLPDRGHDLLCGTTSVKTAIPFTDKLDILIEKSQEKEKAIKIYGNPPNGLWWLEFRLD
ncbi:hypothetical protein AVEN_85797-1, partial [Araneus ventricosus]